MVVINLNIDPKPLKRARTSVRGNYVNTYYDKKSKAEMDDLRFTLISEVNKLSQDQRDKLLIDKPIEVDLTFNMPFPKSYSKKKRAELLATPHMLIPDLDNLIKNVLDRADNILWNNDKYIWNITARKVWSEQGNIIIVID